MVFVWVTTMSAPNVAFHFCHLFSIISFHLAAGSAQTSAIQWVSNGTCPRQKRRNFHGQNCVIDDRSRSERRKYISARGGGFHGFAFVRKSRIRLYCPSRLLNAYFSPSIHFYPPYRTADIRSIDLSHCSVKRDSNFVIPLQNCADLKRKEGTCSPKDFAKIKRIRNGPKVTYRCLRVSRVAGHRYFLGPSWPMDFLDDKSNGAAGLARFPAFFWKPVNEQKRRDRGPI